ncbi:uncharacterized protein LOC110408115 [Numida meleagris]|uniref:uncharacterized protein LOC110408115 n=1 Tax=Numida meleagris TaxID=8996 RepID=UPI000B3DEEE1|nr:uncharacterized protein LOC110408115 [Numida meleagris]
MQVAFSLKMWVSLKSNPCVLFAHMPTCWSIAVNPEGPCSTAQQKGAAPFFQSCWDLQEGSNAAHSCQHGVRARDSGTRRSGCSEGFGDMETGNNRKQELSPTPAHPDSTANLCPSWGTHLLQPRSCSGHAAGSRSACWPPLAFGHRDTLLAHSHPLATRTPGCLSTELLSSSSALNLYSCVWLFLPRRRTLCLLVLNLIRFLSARLSAYLALAEWQHSLLLSHSPQLCIILPSSVKPHSSGSHSSVLKFTGCTRLQVAVAEAAQAERDCNRQHPGHPYGPARKAQGTFQRSAKGAMAKPLFYLAVVGFSKHCTKPQASGKHPAATSRQGPSSFLHTQGVVLPCPAHSPVCCSQPEPGPCTAELRPRPTALAWHRCRGALWSIVCTAVPFLKLQKRFSRFGGSFCSLDARSR